MSIFTRTLAASSALACLFAGGCATITRGTTTDVEFTSEPPGAAMETTTGFWCTTPCTLDMPRRDGFVATFTLPGYQSQEVTVVSGVSTGGTVGLMGNVIAGGVIGAAVDASSGAMNDLTPNPVSVTLMPEGASPAPAAAPVATPSAE